MKIGILSYPLNNNYGCILQTYALKSLLESWGHQVTYIYRRHTIDTFLKFRIQYFFKNALFSNKNMERLLSLSNIELYEQEMLKKGETFIPFFECHFSPHSAPLYSTQELKDFCEGRFDAIIVGSDQVWRPDLLKCISDYFLAFLDDTHVKRIAYAASFGKSAPKFSKIYNFTCGIAFSKFNAVSVREADGINVIRNLGWTGPDAVHVLDPTLILDSQQYIKLLPKEPNNLLTLFCYILDPSKNKKSYIEETARELGLKIDNIIWNQGNEKFVFPSIEDWLVRLSSSNFVITDSFHGTVFSIIFHVPFIIILNNKRGNARLFSLLKMFGLESRILKDDNLRQLIHAEIDWDIVDKKVDERKAFSLDFLRNALNSAPSESRG